MNTIKILIFTIILSNLTLAQKKYNIHTIAFYNLENLFDTKDDPNTFDEDFLPGGSMNWTEKNYQKKLDLLSYA
ncbi:MAG: endonuclease/exonuclease/phosphatase family protein, partial [Flavobacterium sp.]